jgi:hypothetical protein
MNTQTTAPAGVVSSTELDATTNNPARDALGLLAEVAEERMRQDAKWGGAEHDDEHSTAEFVQLIEDYAGWARTMAGMNSPEKAERRLIQVAALALAAVESSRRVRGI